MTASSGPHHRFSQLVHDPHPMPAGTFTPWLLYSMLLASSGATNTAWLDNVRNSRVDLVKVKGR